MIHSLVMNRLLTNSELIWLEEEKEYLNTLLKWTFNSEAKGVHETLILKMIYVQSQPVLIYIPANFCIMLSSENVFIQQILSMPNYIKVFCLSWSNRCDQDVNYASTYNQLQWIAKTFQLSCEWSRTVVC